MWDLSETGRLSMASLFRQIIERNPQIKVLNMALFSGDKDVNENICEIFLETLLNHNIDSIADLDLSSNSSWFKQPQT